MTKIAMHPVIVLFKDGIIVKINYSPFDGYPLETTQGPLGVNWSGIHTVH